MFQVIPHAAGNTPKLYRNSYKANKLIPNVRALKFSLIRHIPRPSSSNGQIMPQKDSSGFRKMIPISFKRNRVPAPISSTPISTAFHLSVLFNRIDIFIPSFFSSSVMEITRSFGSSDFDPSPASLPSRVSTLISSSAANCGKMDISGQLKSFSHLETA